MADHNTNDVDWGRVFAQAVTIARSVHKRDAQDIVQEAMALFFAGQAPRTPEEGLSLAEHLVLVGLSARAKKERAERRHRHPKVVGKLVVAFDAPPPTPEQDVAKAEERATRFEQILVEFACDPEAREVIVLEQQGVHDALAQAERTGRSIEVVRNARKRIKRRVDAIAKRDEQEPVTP